MGRATVQPGDLVAEKYRVERVIGRGGMGLVFAATDVGLGRRVALKCLLPHAWANPAAVARFDREARASVALESEHVCRVLDVGRMPDGAPFIAMELLEGTDLAAELHRRGGRLPLIEAVSFVVQACDAISEAHARGIIHRDLKPSNLFLHQRAGRDPIVKVLDFGISKPTAVGEAPSALTGTADLLGSPLYMSPEQLRAPKTVDARSDIWSLAATLYELVTGKPPFDGTTLADLASNIMSAPAPDVRQRMPNAPAGLAEIILRALAKDRDARYASVDDLARALAPFANASKTIALPAIAAPAPAPSSSTRLLAPSATPRESNRTLPLANAVAPPIAAPSTPRAVAEPPPAPPVHSLTTPLGIIGALVVVIAIAGVILATRSKDETGPAQPTASVSASGSASASASRSAAPAKREEEGEEDATPAPSSSVIEPAPIVPPPSLPVSPKPAGSASPDASAFESAGY